jgi:hypothetical protein
MSSYVLITLDTTAPNPKVFVPSYTTKSARTPITIEADEQLASYQDIYIIDAAGVRHNLTFLHNGDSLVGELYFNDYALGIATIYIRVKDRVDNLSPIISTSFNIIDSEVLTTDMRLFIRDNKMFLGTAKNDMSLGVMKTRMVVEQK